MNLSQIPPGGFEQTMESNALLKKLSPEKVNTLVTCNKQQATGVPSPVLAFSVTPVAIRTGGLIPLWAWQHTKIAPKAVVAFLGTFFAYLPRYLGEKNRDF